MYLDTLFFWITVLKEITMQSSHNVVNVILAVGGAYAAQEGHFVSSSILSSPSKGRKRERGMRVLCWVMLTSCTAPDGALVVLVIC